MIGTLYAVLLGLIVVDGQSKYQQAKLMTETEANGVVDMFHLAYAFPAAPRKIIRDNLMAYTDIVIDKEWNPSLISLNFSSKQQQSVILGTFERFRQLWIDLESAVGQRMSFERGDPQDHIKVSP